jgi:hypothetical protein
VHTKTITITYPLAKDLFVNTIPTEQKQYIKHADIIPDPPDRDDAATTAVLGGGGSSNEISFMVLLLLVVINGAISKSLSSDSRF